MQAYLSLALLLVGLLALTPSRQDELDAVLGRPWQPISPSQKAKLQARFMTHLNEMLTNCYRVEKGEVCRQKMMDVPMDTVYRVHPHRW